MENAHNRIVKGDRGIMNEQARVKGPVTAGRSRFEAPVVDTPFPEKHASHIALPGGRHAADVRTLCAAPDGAVYVATALWLFEVRQEFRPDRPIAELMPEWEPESEVRIAAPKEEINDVRDVRLDGAGRLWACGQTGVFVRDANGWTKVCIPLTVRTSRWS